MMKPSINTVVNSTLRQRGKSFSNGHKHRPHYQQEITPIGNPFSKHIKLLHTKYHNTQHETIMTPNGPNSAEQRMLLMTLQQV